MSDPRANTGWRALVSRHLPDVLMTAGGCAITYGAWLIYEPAGAIVGGALLLIAGLLVARSR